MHLVMFDIDGTLLNSYRLDSDCFVMAVEDILGIKINSDWSSYKHVTDSGIVNQLIHELSLGDQHLTIEKLIKEKFLYRLNNSISNQSIDPIRGANNFLSVLKNRNDIKIALATGSWLESARIKLEACGIDYAGIPIASASDHCERTEIMKLAETKSGYSEYESISYLGDGPWDLEAATKLGYNFILVGNRCSFTPSIEDYSNTEYLINLLIKSK